MCLITTYNYYIWAEFVCAEFVWAEFVMCRVCYGPSLLCAELTRHPENDFYANSKPNLGYFPLIGALEK